MSLARVLNKQYLLLRPSEQEHAGLKKECTEFLLSLRKALAKTRLRTRVFVGGSFAKGTLVKKSTYDIDVFVRMKQLKESRAALEKALALVASSRQLTLKKIHGSRDYFQLHHQEGRVIFEVIPVLDIPRPARAENVTDLSYFHVAYVKKRLKGRMADDVRLAKQFCHAQGVYGAESYIRGFSGYGLECLIINYKTFANLLKALSRVQEPIVLDPAHHYRTAVEARLSLNEAKRQSPIVLVDPTYKERNVLAALSAESFGTFQRAAKQFLTRPSDTSFIEKPFDVHAFVRRAHQKHFEVRRIELHTDRQAGDVAGTKLKKVASYLLERVAPYFSIREHRFDYAGEQHATLFVSYAPKGTIERKGPLIRMKEACAEFKRHHAKTFVKKGRLIAQVTNLKTFEQTLTELTSQHEQMYNMGLTEARIESI